MNTKEPIEIKKSPTYLRLYLLLYAVFACSIASLYLFMNQLIAGGTWVVVAVVSFLGFYWIKKAPPIRITQDGFVFSPKVQYIWDDIHVIQPFKNKLVLRLKNGKNVTVSILGRKRIDRDRMIQMLKEHVPVTQHIPKHVRKYSRMQVLTLTLPILIALVIIWGIIVLIRIPAITIDASTRRKTESHIAYQRIDVKTNRLVYENVGPVHEVYVMPKKMSTDPGEVYLGSHYVKLDDEFVLGFSRYGHENIASIRGFGLWIDSLKKATFSWEWYDNVDGTLYVKRQGGGSIMVEYGLQDGYWTIVAMTFLDDHTLRMDYSWDFRFGDDVDVIVLDGSSIRW